MNSVEGSRVLILKFVSNVFPAQMTMHEMRRHRINWYGVPCKVVVLKTDQKRHEEEYHSKCYIGAVTEICPKCNNRYPRIFFQKWFWANIESTSRGTKSSSRTTMIRIKFFPLFVQFSGGRTVFGFFFFFLLYWATVESELWKVFFIFLPTSKRTFHFTFQFAVMMGRFSLFVLLNFS